MSVRDAEQGRARQRRLGVRTGWDPRQRQGGRLVVRYQNDGTSPFFRPETVSGSTDAGRQFDVPRPVSTHKLALAAFARAVRTRTAPERHREDGQRSLSAVLAAYESAITDRTVPLPLAREDPVTRLGAAGLAQLGASPSSAAVRRRLFGVDEAAGRAVAAAEGG